MVPPPAQDRGAYNPPAIGSHQSHADALRELSDRIVDLQGDVAELRATQEAAAEAGALRALGRMAHDSDHARPYWTNGADHIGQRWWEVTMRAVGKSVIMALAGAILSALLIWYGSTKGKP